MQSINLFHFPSCRRRQASFLGASVRGPAPFRVESSVILIEDLVPHRPHIGHHLPALPPTSSGNPSVLLCDLLLLLLLAVRPGQPGLR